METINVLSLGAGVQSTALYLMLMRGELVPQVDAAIFADTGDEPQAVYSHLQWLISLGGPPILVRSKGRLSDDLLRGQNSTGQRVASVPFFTARAEGAKSGQTRRQCSREYKIDVINRAIRREIVGLPPGRALPAGHRVVQYIGISLDEAARASRISVRKSPRGWSYQFPLIEKRMTRDDCVAYLSDKVPHETPRSACVFCPYHSDQEWVKIKAIPGDWALAVAVDRGVREPGTIVNRNMDSALYAHRSCLPLDQVQFKPESRKKREFQLLMDWECVEGVCGV